MMPTYEQWRRSNWDRAHVERDMSALTGTGLGGHLHTLGVGHLLKEECSILCIGVGSGEWVHEAAKVAGEVWALDVTHKAVRHMPEGAAFRTEPSELPSDRFDLVMSLWVAPHMTDLDLLAQMKEVVRSLKLDGVFALHYKEPMDPTDAVENREGADDEWEVARRAHMLRRPRHMDDMVRWCGGRVVFRAAPNVSRFHRVNEAVVHIQRSEREQ